MATLHPKVQAAGLAGAVSVLIVFVATQLGLDISPGASSALTTVLAFLAGYLKA